MKQLNSKLLVASSLGRPQLAITGSKLPLHKSEFHCFTLEICQLDLSLAVSADPQTPPTLSAENSAESHSSLLSHSRNPWQLASPANERELAENKNVIVTVSAQHVSARHDHGVRKSVGKGWTVAVNASRQLFHPESSQGGDRAPGGKSVGPPSLRQPSGTSSQPFRHPQPSGTSSQPLRHFQPSGPLPRVHLESCKLGKTIPPRRKGKKRIRTAAYHKLKTSKPRNEEIR